ncbi:hypothetical protein M5K25_022325 [Dendrobium thyrsiflorum]|uniref:Uncharacterized protein n=1 Tax=Dendrobium thyrsiflorum TaxID=117978 RepID=A0ABD0U608_DENTH
MASKRLFDPDFLEGSAKSRSFLESLSGSSSDVSFPDIKIASFRGLPSLWISEQEIRALAVPFQFSLVGFLPSKRPSLESIRRFFFNLKLNSEVSVTLLDPSHIDTATSAGSRPSVARVLVELDIMKSYTDKIWLGPKNLGYVQPVSMDEFPSFCASCRCIGHVVGDDSLRDTIDPVVSDVAELELVALDPNVCCVSMEGIPSVLPISDDASLGLETSRVPLVQPISGCFVTRNPCAPNVLASPSYVEAVKAAGVVLDNMVPGDVHSEVVPYAIVPFVSLGGGGDTPILDNSALVDRVCEDAPIVVVDRADISPNAHLVSNGISKVVNILIVVMSDDELRAQVARSVNHSIIVQSDSLNLDESSTPGLDGEFDGQVNDDIYSFMVGKVVDQPILIGGGKKLKSKSNKF